MSDETIRLLNEQVKELRAESAKYRRAHSDLKKAHETKVQEYEAKLGETSKSLEKATAKLESLPKEYEGKVAELQGQIRTRDHRAKFTEVAKELKVREDAVEDLWSLSGYKAEADAPDVEALKEVIGKTVESRGYLLEAERVEAIPARPGPGGGQGGNVGNVANYFQATRAQLGDPKFTFTNRDAITKASQAGTLQVVG